MAKRKHVSQEQYDLFLAALEGIAGEYDMTFEQFTGLHARIIGMTVTLDCWPTTGRYWVKEAGFGDDGRKNEKGVLPLDANDLDAFLQKLFKHDIERAYQG